MGMTFHSPESIQKENLERANKCVFIKINVV